MRLRSSDRCPRRPPLPWTSFPSSSNFAALPTVSWVIPNLLDDMHDGTIAQGDTWLKNNMDAYAQWARTHNSLLIVTWDEDDHDHHPEVHRIRGQHRPDVLRHRRHRHQRLLTPRYAWFIVKMGETIAKAATGGGRLRLAAL
jgi:hypothetical protein